MVASQIAPCECYQAMTEFDNTKIDDIIFIILFCIFQTQD